MTDLLYFTNFGHYYGGYFITVLQDKEIGHQETSDVKPYEECREEEKSENAVEIQACGHRFGNPWSGVDNRRGWAEKKWAHGLEEPRWLGARSSEIV